MPIHAPIMIIGGGPAGYTAAVYAARAGLSPLLVEGMQPGGQLAITTEVENFPGFDTVLGPELMDRMRRQAEHVGARLVSDMIVEVDLSARPYTARGDGGEAYTADAIIIATGAQARWLGVPGEEKLRGFGVSACATCDGFFFRGKRVGVVGGGNTALEEALYLTRHAEHVTVIHRRDRFRGEHVLQERVLKHPKITVVWDHVVAAFLDEGPQSGLTGVALENTKTGERTTIQLDGCFVAIGHAPATGLFRGKLAMDREGYIVTTPDSTTTSVSGVFAAGDVKDRTFRQAVTAAGSGCMAALEAERWLAEAGVAP